MQRSQSATSSFKLKKHLFLADFLPFIVLFFISLYVRFTFSISSGDDIFFSTALDPALPTWTALKNFLVTRYENWSSRLLIETVLAFISPHPTVWRVLDSLIMVLIPFTLNRLLNPQKSILVSWFLCGTMTSLLRSSVISSAGWIATTVNYTWPLAFCLLTLIPAKKILDGEQISPLESIFTIAALLFASNHEQVCLILLALLGLLFMYLLVGRKQFSAFIATELFLLLIHLLFIALCPGNAIRFVTEVSTWFPTFTQLSLLSKIELGFSSTGFLLMMDTNWYYLSFSLLLFLLVSSYRTDRFSRSVSFIPFFAGMFWGPLAPCLHYYFYDILAFRNALTQQGTIATITPKAFIPDIILLFVFLCILYSLFVCCANKPKCLFMIYLLLVSLASRFMMGFSPTIWASEERTSVFLYFGLIALSMMLVRELDRILDKSHFLRNIPRVILALLLSFWFFEELL